MSATDELRRLLDERGIIWQDKTNDGDRCEILPGDSVTWWFDHNDVLSTARENFGHKLALRCECTPAQAVEATLGREMCRDIGYGLRFECSECHQTVGGDKPNFCPNCGREVQE